MGLQGMAVEGSGWSIARLWQDQPCHRVGAGRSLQAAWLAPAIPRFGNCGIGERHSGGPGGSGHSQQKTLHLGSEFPTLGLLGGKGEYPVEQGCLLYTSNRLRSSGINVSTSIQCYSAPH